MIVNGERVELQLFTTLRCNLACKYCSEGVGDIRNSQNGVEYTIDQLDKFVETHFSDKEIIVTFYGGEPLLNTKFIKDVMNRFPLWRCQLQTNGLLLNKLDPITLNRLDNILISIDGNEETNDLYRGKGVYKKVLDNLSYTKKNTDAYLTGRCTWASPSPNAEDILHLTNLFDYVYFQFPHTEWVYTDKYIKNMKITLKSLVETFLTSEELMKIVPLMAFCRNLLFPSRAKELYQGKTQCRVSSHLFNILPDGSVTACPDYAYNKKMTHGSVIENYCNENPLQYSEVFPCKSCIAFDVCRTNCVKGFHQTYIESDPLYKETVIYNSCLFIKYLYKLFTQRDLVKWYSFLSTQDKRELLNSPLYEYIEVMP